MSLFTPHIYSKQYYESKNVLSLCLYKYNPIEIDKYLQIYDIGFALFENNMYYFNNLFVHHCIGISGHPLQPIIKLLSIHCRNSNYPELNSILLDIYNTPNYKKINLINCLTFLLQDRDILCDLQDCTSFDIMFNHFYDKYYIGMIDTNNYYPYEEHQFLYTKMPINIEYNYELISVIIYDSIIGEYSIIIKQDNHFYHYLNNYIIKCDENYLNDIIINKIYGYFYKKNNK